MAGIPQRWNLGVWSGVGAAAGLLSWFSPSAVSSGHELAETVLTNETPLVAIPVLFILRFGLTLASYGTGAAGGIFAPLLLLGALLGLGVGQLTQIFMPALAAEPGVFAVVGMAAYFTAMVRAPLTGILPDFRDDRQLRANVAASRPASFCAYGVTEYLRDMPIYEALLNRDLSRAGIKRVINSRSWLNSKLSPTRASPACLSANWVCRLAV